MSLDSNATLLPCPFCGAPAERIDIEDGENAGGSCVSCTRCLASSNVEFGFKENFVGNWNARSQPSEWVAKVPVEAIEYALATMDLELDYLCSQYSQRPEESGERDTWKRRVALCKAHIESLKALLPPNPGPALAENSGKCTCRREKVRENYWNLYVCPACMPLYQPQAQRRKA